MLFGAPLQAQEAPLTGRAYLAAEQAYAALRNRDYATAVARAREAVNLRPDLLRLRLLLIDALIGADDIDEADAVISDVLVLFPGDPDLIERQRRSAQLRAQKVAAEAYAAADGAYKAYDRKDYDAAIAAARRAVLLQPNNRSYRLLLVNCLIAAENLNQAETAVSEALALFSSDRELLERRDFIRNQRAVNDAYTAADKAYKAFAEKDYDSAVAEARTAVLLQPTNRAYRLLLINSLLAVDKLEEALTAVFEARLRVGPDPEFADRETAIRQALAQRPLSEAFAAADAAYRAFARKDYAAASTGARRAVELDPNNLSYRLLLINCLIAAGRREEAEKAIADAIAQFGSDPELLARQQSVARGAVINEAYTAAEEAYKAFARKDYAAALAAARKAVKLAPDNEAYWLLLINTLVAAGQPGEAEQVASQRLAHDNRNPELWAQRGFARQRLRKHAAAIDDFATALRLNLPAAQTRGVRLALADSALTARQPQRAVDALKPFGRVRDYDVAARRAFALKALKRLEQALAEFEIGAETARTASERATMVSGVIGTLVDLQRKEAARERFAVALAKNELRTMKAVDIAYLAVQVGEDRIAYEYFEQARAAGQLRGRALLDAGGAAKRAFENEAAISFFMAGIDAHEAGALPLEPQRLFGVRREIADLSRSWGAYASVTYSRIGAAIGQGGGFPVPGGGYTAQLGREIYWRPPVIGYRNGSTFEVYGRVFETLYDQTGGPVLDPTQQGYVGARWKPIGTIDMVFDVARMYAIGSVARNDILLRVGYSKVEGTDLRVDVPDWLTYNLYAEFDYFAEKAQSVSVVDFRPGRSFRLDFIEPHFVFFPHVVMAFNYDSKLAHPKALGAGPGATLRYWFREDKYTAPMSYIDWTVQYRTHLAGDIRAQGWFLQVFVSY
jgi:tetratricopeptide (TPR) repeat protein